MVDAFLVVFGGTLGFAAAAALIVVFLSLVKLLLILCFGGVDKFLLEVGLTEAIKQSAEATAQAKKGDPDEPPLHWNF